MWPWESTGHGYESGPGSAEGQRELHISSDIAFAFLQYYRATHDEAWLRDVAYPVLNETARYWQSRAVLRTRAADAAATAHILDVMGPDEWHDHTNDSAFTNAGAKIALRFAADASEVVGDAAAPAAAWRALADQLVVIYNETTRVTAEYDHYDGGSTSGNPSWAPQQIPGLIKQADTVLLQYPLHYNQSRELSARNLEYYGKRVDVQGGPAMTWCVHAIGYLRIGQRALAASMFNRSYQNNVRTGAGAQIRPAPTLWGWPVWG
jgi:trehalose/maltose hydrolase-like predicted phosphorylase